MADVKISAAADIGTVVATDKVPVARSASTTAYAATMAELATYANGAYTPSYFGGSPSMDGTAAPGTSALVGRGDHVHPTDTSRYAASNPSGYQTAAQVATAVAPYANDVGRNLIHNPMFNVAQRGAGPWTTNGMTLDRWAIGSGGDTFSVTSPAVSDANRASIGDEAAEVLASVSFTGAAGAGNYVWISQAIEDVRRLAGKTVTISFYANAGTASMKIGVSLDQHFGSGGSPSADVNGTGQAVTLSTTVAQFGRYSVTLAVPSVSGKTLGTSGDSSTRLGLWLSSGSANATRAGNIGVQSGTINLWGVQLEVGSVATPLEKLDPGLDLRNCQRFFQFSNFNYAGYAGAGTGAYASYPLVVKMRGIPTVTITPTTQTNCGSSTSINPLSEAVTPYTVVTVAGGYIFAGYFTASADL